MGAGVGDGVGVTGGAGVGIGSAVHPTNDSARMEKSAAKKMVWAKARDVMIGYCSKQIKP